mgnify:CR=1 FL=1
MPQIQTNHRKLAAIMFTDMVGYSQLTRKNEPLALDLLEEHRAFHWLQTALHERSSWMVYIKVNPLLDSLRADPRLPQLLQKVGLEKS